MQALLVFLASALLNSLYKAIILRTPVPTTHRSWDVSYTSFGVQKDDLYTGQGRVERSRRDLRLRCCNHVAVEQNFRSLTRTDLIKMENSSLESFSYHISWILCKSCLISKFIKVIARLYTHRDCKFTTESAGGKILKIGWHLGKLLAIVLVSCF